MKKYKLSESIRRKNQLEFEIPQCKDRNKRERLLLEYSQLKREIKNIENKTA